LSETTLARLGDDEIWYGAAAAAEWHDRDWLAAHLPKNIRIDNLSQSHTVLVLAGPKSREVLQHVAGHEDWSNEGFPIMAVKRVVIGHAEAMVMRISYSGEMAWEIHVPNEQLYLIWTLLMDGGEDFGIAPFGLYATESMRLEKGYRHWKADLMVEFNPAESGLDRFYQRDKNDYIGREGFEAQLQQGLRKRFVTMVVDADHAPAHGGDGIFCKGEQVGSVTSGGYGHRVKANIAYGFIDPDVADDAALTIRILDEDCQARITIDALYDPQNTKQRGDD